METTTIGSESNLYMAIITSKATRSRVHTSMLYSLTPFVHSGNILFLTDDEEEQMPHLWFNTTITTFAHRVYQGLEHMYHHSPPTVEWFMVADDDTFIFSDTLMRTLHQYRGMVRERNLYIGNYNENNKGDKFYFPFGGGGLILNRRLLRWVWWWM